MLAVLCAAAGWGAVLLPTPLISSPPSVLPATNTSACPDDVRVHDLHFTVQDQLAKYKL
jgi:hypothetical protein